MNKELIAKLAHEMKTKQDLLNLLNRIKGAEMAEEGFADKFFPITTKQINYYCNPNNTFHRYTTFKIPKKKKGQYREITAPRSRTFMEILRYVNTILGAIYSPSAYAMGFAEGRSVVSNAEVHKGQNYILNIDLKDFFPSIVQPRVWKRLQVKPFCFPQPVANVLAGICCMKKVEEMPDGSKEIRYILPQGAPTSPIITNMICDRLDHRLAGVAKRFGLRYTRYADDITFSSMHNVYQSQSEFWKEIKRIIADQGFTINDAKTRLQKRGGRQEVTGVVVSKKLNVTQEYTRNIRNILYMWEKYGYDKAYAHFLQKYQMDKGHVKKGVPDMGNVLNGKLLYMKMVKGENDSVFSALKQRYDNLMEHSQMESPVEDAVVISLETIGLSEFEMRLNTKICIKHTEDKRYAIFALNGKNVHASVAKDITQVEESSENLVISYCIGNNKPFWLIHKEGKKLVTLKSKEENITIDQDEEVDIDELNNDLDSLLEN